MGKWKESKDKAYLYRGTNWDITEKFWAKECHNSSVWEKLIRHCHIGWGEKRGASTQKTNRLFKQKWQNWGVAVRMARFCRYLNENKDLVLIGHICHSVFGIKWSWYWWSRMKKGEREDKWCVWRTKGREIQETIFRLVYFQSKDKSWSVDIS